MEKCLWPWFLPYCRSLSPTDGVEISCSVAETSGCKPCNKGTSVYRKEADRYWQTREEYLVLEECFGEIILFKTIQLIESRFD
jgi:hypothetical protein